MKEDGVFRPENGAAACTGPEAPYSPVPSEQFRRDRIPPPFPSSATNCRIEPLHLALIAGCIFRIYFFLSSPFYFYFSPSFVQPRTHILRSPIYAHFTETLGGLSAIRAFGHVNLFARTNERLVDNNFAAQFALKVGIQVAVVDGAARRVLYSPGGANTLATRLSGVG